MHLRGDTGAPMFEKTQSKSALVDALPVPFLLAGAPIAFLFFFKVVLIDFSARFYDKLSDDICTFSTYRATLVFIFTSVCVHTMDVSQTLTLLVAVFCSSLTSEGFPWFLRCQILHSFHLLVINFISPSFGDRMVGHTCFIRSV